MLNKFLKIIYRFLAPQPPEGGALFTKTKSSLQGVRGPVFCILFLLFIISSRAFAIGTLAGTSIDNTSTAVTLSFSGAGLITFNVTSSAQISATVQSIQGFNFNQIVTTNLTVPTTTNVNSSAGVLGYAREFVTNISNKPVTINFQTIGTVKALSGNPGTTANWIFGFTNPNLNFGADTATDNFAPNVTPANNALNGSIAGISVNVSIEGYDPATPNTQYTGFNGNTYAGYNFYQYQLTGTVNGPEMVIVTRSVQSIAPTINGYFGANNATVPGSKLIYTIVVQNIGSADAATVNVSDLIPQNASYAEFLVGSASGTGTPTLTYFNPVTPVTPAGTVDSNVKKINWEFSTIGVGESRTLNYTVVIK